jgi:hypothetical protein
MRTKGTSADQGERHLADHIVVVRDGLGTLLYAEFEVDAERVHKSTRQRDEATAQAVADRWYEKLSPPPPDAAKPA